MLAFALPVMCASFLAAPSVALADGGDGGSHGNAPSHDHGGSPDNGGSQPGWWSHADGHGHHYTVPSPKAGAAKPAVKAPAPATAPAPPPVPHRQPARSPQSLVKSGLLSVASGSSHPAPRPSTVPPVFIPGPPAPTTAPVVIGSSGVVSAAPLVIAITTDWVPVIVVMLLLLLVVLALILTSRRRRRVDVPPAPLAGHF